MRHVHTSNMVAHLYANQSQDHARNAGGTFSFSGRILYSYSTPIAAIVDAADGSCALLLSDNKHSNTTAQHLSHAWRAWGSSLSIFYVPSLGASGGRHYENGTQVDHAGNLASLVAGYDAQKRRLLRMLGEPYQPIAEYLTESAAHVMRYAEAFRLPCALTPNTDAAEIEAERAKRRAKRETPAYLAKRERERARRAEREAERVRLANLTGEQRLAEWLAGANVYVPTYTSSADRMRLHSNGYEVETLRGARVPIGHARSLFEWLQRFASNGKEYNRTDGGLPIRVGSFVLESVDIYGTVRIGCHRFEWLEVMRFARVMGWTEAKASEGGAQ